MSVTSVKVVLNPALLNPFITNVADMSASKAARLVAVRAGLNVMAAGRVRTGALAKSYTHRKTANIAPGQVTYTVRSIAPYSDYQEEGTAGSAARPGGVLRFKPKGASAFVFATRTKGVRAGHFLQNAYRALSLGDFLP